MMLECQCGFTCGAASVFARHRARYTGPERDNHQLLTSSDAGDASREEPRAWAGKHSTPPDIVDSSREGIIDPVRPRTRGWIKLRQERGSEPFSKAAELPEPRSTRSPSEGSESMTLSELSSAVSDLLLQDDLLQDAADDAGSMPALTRSISPARGKDLPPLGHVSKSAFEPCLKPLSTWTTSGSGFNSPASRGDDLSTPTEPGTRTSPEHLLRPESGANSPALPASTRTLPSDDLLASAPRRSAFRLDGIHSLARSLIGLDFRDTTTPRMEKCSITTAQSILLWNDSWLSLRVFGLGLYLLICLHHYVGGSIMLLPSTLLSSAGMSCLAYNIVRNHLRPKRASSLRDRELQAQQAVTTALHKVAMALIPVAGAVAGLAVRTFSGQRLAPTVWLSTALLLVLSIGQLQVVGQVTLLMMVWVGLFTLPWLYLACRHAMDALVEEAVKLLADHLALFPRPMLIASGVLGLVAASLVEAAVLVQLVVAAVTAGGFLYWNHRRLQFLPGPRGMAGIHGETSAVGS